jgi:dihydroorotate dehydrogenase (NAD+) catalytic subunit
MFGTDEQSLAQLVRALRAATQRPLVVKLTPNVADIGVFAEICEENGADGLSTVEARRPVIGNVTGGISGPAIRPMGVYATWKVASRVKLPVIGIGGICNARDTMEYILAGAALVQIGTAMFVDPHTAPETIEGLREICARQGVDKLSQLVGALEA